MLTYSEMQRDSVFEFFTIQLRLDLTFRMGQESYVVAPDHIRQRQCNGVEDLDE